MNKFSKNKASKLKDRIIREFSTHVSKGKAAFFSSKGMDFIMDKRHGPWMYDIDGEKKLFNLHCNGGVFNLGHRNPKLIHALQEGLKTIDIGNHHLMSRYRSGLAKMLADLLPGNLTYTVFGVGGGEAVDLAIKVARAHTGRKTILSAKGGYHGHTGLSMATGDIKYRQLFGPQLPGFEQLSFNDINAWRACIDDTVAAVLLETVPATLGMQLPTIEFIQGIRALCDQTGTLLILDEVQAGLGRTGKLWAFEHFDIIPDILVLGKGLSGGIYPLSATIISDELEHVFHKDPFIHISTFGGSEIGCVVAMEVLKICSDQTFLKHVNILAERFSEELNRLKHKYPKLVVEIRQIGLMIGIKMNSDLAGPVLTKMAYDRDLLMIYANNETSVCQLLPPLNIKESELDFVFSRLDDAINITRKSIPLVGLKQSISNWFKG